MPCATEGRPLTRADLYDSILEGAVESVRPKAITVAAVVTTADGKTRVGSASCVSSKDGPEGGAPEEIGKFIESKC